MQIVEYLVNYVSQFPGDAELIRFISTVSDNVSSGAETVKTLTESVLELHLKKDTL